MGLVITERENDNKLYVINITVISKVLISQVGWWIDNISELALPVKSKVNGNMTRNDTALSPRVLLSPCSAGLAASGAIESLMSVMMLWCCRFTLHFLSASSYLTSFSEHAPSTSVFYGKGSHSHMFIFCRLQNDLTPENKNNSKLKHYSPRP